MGDPNMGALISPQFFIPHMLSFYVNAFGTKGSLKSGQLSLSSGLGLALNAKKLSDDATIEHPIIYTRLTVYLNGLIINFGGEYYRKLSKSINYLIDYKMYLMPGGRGRYSFEQQGLLMWQASSTFTFSFGYKLIAGEYPFGLKHTYYQPLIFNLAGKYLLLKVSSVFFLSIAFGQLQDETELLINELGCGNCHAGIEKSSVMSKRAPNLSYAGSKYNTSFIYNYLQSPHSVRKNIGRSRMPNFYFTEKEAFALSIYLASKKSDNEKRHNIQTNTKLDAKELIVDSYQCTSCHIIENEEKIIQ